MDISSKTLAASIVAISALGAHSSASAEGHGYETCLDKGSLSHFDCGAAAPQPVPVYAPPPVGLEVLPDYTWTGFYLGAHAGLGIANVGGTFDGDDVDRLDLGQLDDKGFVIGGQIGYDLHFYNDIVVGLEVDGSYTDLDSQVSNADPETGEFELNYAATARAKFGYALGRMLPYVSAGVGVIDFEGTVVDDTAASQSISETVVTPVFGAGVEFFLTDDITAGVDAQYFYVDERANLTLTDSAAGDNFRLDDVWTVRARVNFRLY